MTNPTVTVREAADLMKVHPQTVLDKIAACELPAARMGKHYVLLTKDVLDHIEAAVVRQTAQRMRAPLTRGVPPGPRQGRAA